MGSPYLSCPLPRGLLPQLVLSQAPTQSSALGQGRRSAQLEKRLGLAPWHHPQDLNTHSADPSHRMVTSHGKVFLELPPDLGPSLHTLQSHSCLWSGSFWKPEDPHSDLEARTGLGSQGSPLPWRSLGLPGGAPEYTWPGGVRAAIAHFFLYQVRPSASWFLPCATEGGG